MSERRFLTDDELDRNYDAFKSALPKLMEKHAGRFAIVRDRVIVDVYDTIRDAHLAGWRQFNDELFSVQQVTDEPVYLGIFSHVFDIRET